MDPLPPTPAADAGVYRLTIRLREPVRLRAGRLGSFDLPAGVYVYCGSAQRNLAARLARHRRKRKTRRWHVDYLLTRREARLERIETFAADKAGECALARQARADGGVIVAPGFGASDCRNGCGAHLLWMGE